MDNLTLLGKNILIDRIERGEQKTVGGIIIIDDEAKERGIRSRWGRVFKLGPDVDDISIGDWIYIEHGRWSFSFEATIEGTEGKFRWVDYKDVHLVADELPDGIAVE